MRIKEILNGNKIIDIVQFRRDNVEDVYNFTKGRLHSVMIPRSIDGIMTGEIDDTRLYNSINILENDYIFKSEDMRFIVYKPREFEKIKDVVNTICKHIFSLDGTVATFGTEFKLKEFESIHGSNTVVPVEFLKFIEGTFI